MAYKNRSSPGGGVEAGREQSCMTVGIAMTVPNKFRLCVVLMFQTVITLSLTLAINITYIKFYKDII